MADVDAPVRHAGDALAGGAARFGPLCLGLDPHPTMIPARFGPPGPRAARDLCLAALEAVGDAVGIVKPQMAFFERWGPEGLQALGEVCAAARSARYAIILDAKRGDIGSTAAAYAHAYLGPDAWLGVDAVTVNAFMGLDTLAPWLEASDAHGGGVVVLARTSNPGAAGVQGLSCDGAPMWERFAADLAPHAAERRGRSGWSRVLAVVGATAPDEARRARALLPHSLFLVPGYGAQGAGPADAVAGAVRGAGVIVNASRSVLFAADPDASPAAWAQATREAALRARDALSAAF